MKTVELGKTGLQVPALICGCMRLETLSTEEIARQIAFLVDHGINYFDHADIYGMGSCELLFSDAFSKTDLSRDKILLQSKCGIVPGVMYNFDKDYILGCVDDILMRLDTDYLDVLLLHRPDALMEPEEVAEAFNSLQNSGKVRRFGVSNFRSMQVELLQSYLDQKLEVNQLQFNVSFSQMIAAGLESNMLTSGSLDRDGQILDYSRLKNMTIQTWSPFQFGFFEGAYIGNDRYPKLNACLDELAEKYRATPTAIATAWILRHPGKMQVIGGSTNLDRWSEMIQGSKIHLSREDWYKLYLSAGHILP